MDNYQRVQCYVVQTVVCMEECDTDAIQLRPRGSADGMDSLRLPPGHGLSVGDLVTVTVKTEQKAA